MRAIDVCKGGVENRDKWRLRWPTPNNEEKEEEIKESIIHIRYLVWWLY